MCWDSGQPCTSTALPKQVPPNPNRDTSVNTSYMMKPVSVGFTMTDVGGDPQKQTTSCTEGGTVTRRLIFPDIQVKTGKPSLEVTHVQQPLWNHLVCCRHEPQRLHHGQQQDWLAKGPFLLRRCCQNACQMSGRVDDTKTICSGFDGP